MSRKSTKSSSFQWKYLPAELVLKTLQGVAKLPYSMSYAIYRGLSGLLFHFMKSRKQIIRRNIERCFPEKSSVQINQLVKNNCRETLSLVSDAFFMGYNCRRRFMSKINFVGTEHLQSALDENKGVILLTCHMLACTLSVGATRFKFDWPMNIVYRTMSSDFSNDFFVRTTEEKLKVNMIAAGRTTRIVRCLKKGGMLWYAPDQSFDNAKTSFAPFFNIQTATLVAIRDLVRLTGAKVVPMLIHRNKNKKFEIEYFPELKNFPTDDAVADATRMNKIIEDHVVKYPEQYLWMHRRFKVRPKGETLGFYD